MTNQEMLIAAIEFEEIDFAYDLFYLMSYGHIDSNAEYQDLGAKWNLVDAGVTKQMMEQNLLGFNQVHLYCVKLNVDEWEVFAARNDQEARGYMLNKYGSSPKIVKMDKSKWLKEFWLPDTKEFKSLLDIRKENNVFPRTLLII